MQAMRSKGAMLDQIDLNKVPRSGFDMSYHCHGTSTLGKLIPIRKVSTIPADRWQGQTDININFQPLAYPMASNMYLKTESFYVPKRILWDKWEKFWTKGEDLSDTSVVPSVSLNDIMNVLLNPSLSQGHSYLQMSVSGSWSEITDPRSNTSLYSNLLEVGSINSFVKVVYFEVGTLTNHINRIKFTLTLRAENHYASDLVLDALTACDSLLRWIDENYLMLEYPTDDNHPAEKIILATQLTLKGLLDDDEYQYVTTNIPFPKEVQSDVLALLPAYEWTKPTLVPLYGLIDKYAEIIGENKNFADFYSLILEPSDEFITLARMYSDIWRPFVGLGSVLDYLGYPCVSGEDWLALFFTSYIEACIQISDGQNLRVLEAVGNNVFTSYNNSNIEPFSTKRFSVLPLRAYYSVWYWHYRDQLLETGTMEPQKTDIVTSEELQYLLYPRYRAWTKDTFTTALDNTGTGSVVVALNEDAIKPNTYQSLDNLMNLGSEEEVQGMDIIKYQVSDGTILELPSRYVLNEHGVSSATGSSIGFSLDMLNRAKRLQKWIQKALIYGNRPQDALWTHFGVRASSVRLEEPEYITGDTSLVQLSVVMNNTTTSESVAGDKTGNAFGNMQGSGMSYFSEEHGFILSMMSVMPEAVYGYGIDKDNLRLDAFDLPFPEFAQLGMDAVYTDEMVASPLNDGFLPHSTEVFGYQGRYYDHKSKQDEIHGEFRGPEMDGYTFARKFSVYDTKNFPRLNYAFIHCHPRTDMFVTADPSVDLFWFDAYHSQALERALPVPSQVF